MFLDLLFNILENICIHLFILVYFLYFYAIFLEKCGNFSKTPRIAAYYFLACFTSPLLLSHRGLGVKSVTDTRIVLVQCSVSRLKRLYRISLALINSNENNEHQNDEVTERPAFEYLNPESCDVRDVAFFIHRTDD